MSAGLRLRPYAALLASVALATACGAAHTPAPPVHVAVSSLADGRQPWAKPLTISVSDGTLREVAVSGPSGRVDGTLGEDGWSSRDELWPASTYTVTLTARDGDGHRDRRSLTVTTTDAPRLGATLTPGDGDTVGVGMPVRVQFNRKVPESAQAAVARRVTVTATPATSGGWRWLSPTELHWRPTRFWQAHTRVHVAVDLTGVHVGGDVWGGRKRTTDYTIGDAVVSTVDIAKHTMTVTRNGQVLRVMPMSAGRDEFPTHRGVHITLEKAADITMDSETVGIPRNSPNGYYEKVQWNVRIAYSGEFVHSAPWSVSNQGSRNVSHGCVNLSPENAQWFYKLAQRGDVVNVVGGGAPPVWYDPGTFDWNSPASEWKQ